MTPNRYIQGGDQRLQTILELEKALLKYKRTVYRDTYYKDCRRRSNVHIGVTDTEGRRRDMS